MAKATKREQPAPTPAVDIDAEIARVSAMNVAELRRLWPEVFGAQAPNAFSKDLLARAIAYRVQERACGGIKPQTLRLLRAVMTPGTEPPRQVKVGSVIVREHRSVLHEVTVVPGGFCWNGQTYDSLSTIAKKITGVNWNGPRFFGLRGNTAKTGDAGGGASVDEMDGKKAKASDEALRDARARRAGRRSSLRTGAAP